MRTPTNLIRAFAPSARPIPALIAGCLLLCGSAVPARAANIDDVFNVVDRIETIVIGDRNRLRDEVGPNVGDIKTKVTGIQTTVQGTASTVVATAADVVDVRGRVQEIQAKMLDIGTNNAEIILQMRNGVAALAGNAQTLIDETILDLQQFVDEHLDGRDDFVNNEATQFRADILAFLTSIEEVINTLSEMTGTNVTVNFSRERNLLNNIPDRHLYPLYRVFQAVELAKMANALSVTFSNLNLVRLVFEADVVGSSSAFGFAPEGGPLDACQLIQANPGIEPALKVLSKLESGALKLNAKIMHALGDKAADAEITVGGWGFVLTTLKVNVPNTIASLMEGVADLIEKVVEKVEEKIEKVVEKVEEKIDKCEILFRHEELLTQLDNIKTKLNALEGDLATLVSSRASQASVDALATTLGGLNTAPLDVAVSTRASQAALDVLTAKVDTHGAMALRLQVELQLSDNTRHPSILFLPEARGGKLGLVRAVVVETLATNVAAGLYSGTLAGEELQNGDAAVATNDFRGAFDSYRRAYQEIVRWPVSASIQSGQATGAFEINWPSDPGGIYLVEFSSDLTTWSSLLTKVIGEAGHTEVNLTASGAKGFYRVFRLSSYDPTVNGS